MQYNMYVRLVLFYRQVIIGQLVEENYRNVQTNENIGILDKRGGFFFNLGSLPVKYLKSLLRTKPCLIRTM